MAKKQSLKGKNEGELIALLSKQREELRALRFSAAGSRPKDNSEPKKARRQIARIMTELHAQKSEAAHQAEITTPEVVTAEAA
jgi:ribosomal protein L29